MSKKAIGLFAAISLVIANMVGTGVFTSLGYQVTDIQSVSGIVILWLLGGLLALCGALAYGEIGAALPRSGGEYHYLSVIYHPSIGFASGWVSSIVGFSAPVALAATALGRYFSHVINIPPEITASCVVILITLLHGMSLHAGVGFQNIFTSIKAVLIVAFIAIGFFMPAHENFVSQISHINSTEIFSTGFAISLMYVSYAYSGWNAASYIAGDIEQPEKNLPRSLFIGTATVTVLYILLNYVFMRSTPIAELKGQVEVGFISATHIFGTEGGRIMSGIISLLLISTISSMIITGPRVVQAIGEDIGGPLKFVARKKASGVPFIAIIMQSLISLTLILTSSFEQVLLFAGFTLNLFTFLTVLGVFILRIKRPDIIRPYKTWGYPLTPIFFLVLSLWIMFNLITQERTMMPSIYGVLTALSGLIVYYLLKSSRSTPNPLISSDITSIP